MTIKSGGKDLVPLHTCGDVLAVSKGKIVIYMISCKVYQIILLRLGLFLHKK